MLERILQSLHPTYQPLNKIELSSENLLYNYHYLSSLVKELKTAPVLKSNAYGHGIVPVAKILDSLGTPFFCVDSLYEAYQLFNEGIKTPILVMGYIHPESLKVKKLPFSLTVYNSKVFEAIKKYQPHAGIHIFVDTGMGREGVSLKELPHIIIEAQKLSLNIEGLMSHLAMADKPENEYTQKQIVNFEKATRIVNDLSVSPKWIHLPASLGLTHHKSYSHSLGNLARIGIALYGIDPEQRDKKLKPVLELKSTIAQIKEICKGEQVGYDFTFTAQKNIKTAVLPIGYNDGIDRRLSNKGFVLVNNKPCPIIGRVSMNITVIDVTDVLSVEVGQEVTIYSRNPDQKNSVASAAILCETIPDELLVHLIPTTKRIII
ncbi:MAG: alanine racemase [Patescibacteria group bacterium]|nr:alanine racemase [Patescibacteria group bacterium]